MSTRSTIARHTSPGQFQGVYHHWDGYPEGLGATLFDLYGGFFKRDLERMLKLLIDDHPGGWSSINGADMALTPGYESHMNQPCIHCKLKSDAHYVQHWFNWNASGGTKKDFTPIEGVKTIPGFGRATEKKLRAFYDEATAGQHSYLLADHAPEATFVPYGQRVPQCYCHGERSEEGWVVTQENASGSGCEWAYVFARSETGRDQMLVMSSYTTSGTKMIGAFGFGAPDAEWRPVAVIDLNGPEPDWARMTKDAYGE